MTLIALRSARLFDGTSIRTGHAVLVAQPELAEFRGDVLILYGDIPLLRPETLRSMAELRARSGADLLICDRSQASSVDAVVDFVVARVLDQLGIEHTLMSRWGEQRNGDD